MTRLHFSLAGLLAAVGVLAVAFAMLRSQSELPASLAFTGNVGVFAFALVGLVWRRGQDRLFWLGFVVLNGIYNGLAFGTPFYVPMPFGNQGSGLLVTTHLLNQMHAMQQVPLQVGGRVSVNYRGSGTYYPGRIRAIAGPSYDIAFDDGSQEWAPASRLRNLTNPEQTPRLIVGEAVSVNFRGSGTFFPGRIRAVEAKMYDLAGLGGRGGRRHLLSVRR